MEDSGNEKVIIPQKDVSPELMAMVTFVKLALISNGMSPLRY